MSNLPVGINYVIWNVYTFSSYLVDPKMHDVSQPLTSLSEGYGWVFSLVVCSDLSAGGFVNRGLMGSWLAGVVTGGLVTGRDHRW